jgi:hypothetical protein
MLASEWDKGQGPERVVIRGQPTTIRREGMKLQFTIFVKLFKPTIGNMGMLVPEQWLIMVARVITEAVQLEWRLPTLSMYKRRMLLGKGRHARPLIS